MASQQCERSAHQSQLDTDRGFLIKEVKLYSLGRQLRVDKRWIVKYCLTDEVLCKHDVCDVHLFNVGKRTKTPAEDFDQLSQHGASQS
jgi:hypothetical protein